MTLILLFVMSNKSLYIYLAEYSLAYTDTEGEGDCGNDVSKVELYLCEGRCGAAPGEVAPPGTPSLPTGVQPTAQGRGGG